MADMFTITTIEKLPERLTNANFIMVGKNGGEKGHEFDCSHSFAQSCNIHIKEIEKEDPSKLKFWKSRSKKNDEKIKKLEVARDGQ